MVNRPSIPEIITVNSEGLQQQIRDLLPSQNGFGSELQASNVITPIIDLTAAAEGSGLPAYLQQALAFGSQTVFDVFNTTETIINQTGFFRILGTANVGVDGTSSGQAIIRLNDGATTKNVFNYNNDAFATTTDSNQITQFDVIVFLRAGDSVQVFCNSLAQCNGSTRQIATGDGSLVQPNGFPL